MSNISERLKLLRDKLGVTQSDIAETVGVSQQSWAHYERGSRKPSLKVVQQLGVRYDVDLNWLISERSSDTVLVTSEPGEPYEVTNIPEDFDSDKSEFVPFLEAPLGAGNSGNADIIQPRSYMAFDKKWLRHEAQVTPERAFVAQIYGQSMKDLLLDGDLVLGERQKDVLDGVMAVVYDGELLVKHVILRRDSLQLVSENERYPPIKVHESDPFFPIGRVVRKVVKL